MDAHRAWRILRKWDHAGIAPIFRVTKVGPVSASSGACAVDEVAFVGEGEVAGLDAAASTALGVGSLHLWGAVVWGRIAASEASAESGEE